MKEMKITLNDPHGGAVAHYKITSRPVRPTRRDHHDTPCHHVVLVDRAALSAVAHNRRDMTSSGAPTPNLSSSAQHLINKLLTLEEYQDPKSFVSLISLDEDQVTTHLERATLGELMRDDSPELLEACSPLDTCPDDAQLSSSSLSQALSAVAHIIRSREVSLITLHTASPRAQSIGDQTLEQASSLQSVTSALNVVMYGASPDPALQRLTSLGGGVCVESKRLRHVYDALHQRAGALRARASQVTEISVGSASGWLLASPHLESTLWGEGDAELTDLALDEEGRLYLFEELDQETYDALKLSALNPMSKSGYLSSLALSRFALARGQLNLAKYALWSSKSTRLVSAHMRALTASAIGSLSRDLDELLTAERGRRNDPALSTPERSPLPSVLEVMRLLQRHRHDVKLSSEHLKLTYERCGLRREVRTPGEDEASDLEITTYQPKRDGELSLHHVELCEGHASLNIVTAELVGLRNMNGQEIGRIAGVDLSSLKQFRSYAVIEDGRLHLSTLRLRIEHKSLFAQLAAWGLVEGEYDPTRAQLLDLSGLPLVTQEPETAIDDELFSRVAHARLLRSFLNATLGEYSERFTEAQVEALRAHNLTSKLHLNLPTVSPYPDLKLARRGGLVGVRSRHRFELGDRVFSSLSQLPSANKLLRSTYLVTRGDELIKHPTVDQLTDEVELKLKPRLRSSVSRALLKPLFDELIGATPSYEGSPLDQLLGRLSLDQVTLNVARRALNLRARDEMSLAALNTLRSSVCDYLKSVYAQQVSPLALYVGATGLIPRMYESRVHLPDDVESNLKTLKVTRDQGERCVFTLGESLTLSVRSEEVWFSIDERPQARREPLVS